MHSTVMFISEKNQLLYKPLLQQLYHDIILRMLNGHQLTVLKPVTGFQNEQLVIKKASHSIRIPATHSHLTKEWIHKVLKNVT